MVGGSPPIAGCDPFRGGIIRARLARKQRTLAASIFTGGLIWIILLLLSGGVKLGAEGLVGRKTFEKAVAVFCRIDPDRFHARPITARIIAPIFPWVTIHTAVIARGRENACKAPPYNITRTLPDWFFPASRATKRLVVAPATKDARGNHGAKEVGVALNYQGGIRGRGWRIMPLRELSSAQ